MVFIMANVKLVNVDMLQYFKGKQDAYNDGVYAKKADITTVFRYKGTVDNFADLPSTDQAVGDTYNVVNADKANNVKAGDNVVWNGTAWDVLSGIFDINDAVKVQAETMTAGVKVATITVNGVDTDINVPAVTAASEASTGLKLATITINGTATEVYAEVAENADIDALFASV